MVRLNSHKMSWDLSCTHSFQWVARCPVQPQRKSHVTLGSCQTFTSQDHQDPGERISLHESMRLSLKFHLMLVSPCFSTFARPNDCQMIHIPDPWQHLTHSLWGKGTGVLSQAKTVLKVAEQQRPRTHLGFSALLFPRDSAFGNASGFVNLCELRCDCVLKPLNSRHRLYRWAAGIFLSWIQLDHQFRHLCLRHQESSSTATTRITMILKGMPFFLQPCVSNQKNMHAFFLCFL